METSTSMLTTAPPTPQKTVISIDTLVNTALNISDDKDKNNYTNSWDVMRLYNKIGNFAVNSTMPFYDVGLLEVFSEEEEE